MTFLGIVLVFILGIVLLIIGLATERKWFIYLSIIPLAVSIWQIVYLLSIR